VYLVSAPPTHMARLLRKRRQRGLPVRPHGAPSVPRKDTPFADIGFY